MTRISSRLPASTELGYAERTTNDTTTNTDYNAVTTNKISGLSVTVVGQGLPVLVEFYCPLGQHSVTGSGVAVALVINGALTSGQYVTSNGIDSMVLRRRLLLAAGASYTFEVGMWLVTTAGTGTYSGGSDFPMHLSVNR